MGKSRKLATASSKPVAANYRLTFHLCIPLSTDLVISDDPAEYFIRSRECTCCPFGIRWTSSPVSLGFYLVYLRQDGEQILLFPSLRYRHHRHCCYRLQRSSLFVFRFDGWWLMGRFISVMISDPWQWESLRKICSPLFSPHLILPFAISFYLSFYINWYNTSSFSSRLSRLSKDAFNYLIKWSDWPVRGIFDAAREQWRPARKELAYRMSLLLFIS